MEVSVFLKDYIEKLKNVELKKYYIESEKGFVIKDIHDFLKVVDIFQREKDKDRNATLKEYYFRGVSNKEWDLNPSLVVNDLEYYESVMMEEFMKAYPSEFEMDDSFEIIAKMQHFGLPTRVLDFTTNPLVALYFACSDMKQAGKDGKVIITLPRRAAFLIFEGEDYYKEHYSNGQFDLRLHPTLKKISKRQYKYNFTELIIPAGSKEQILEQLANIGIAWIAYLLPLSDLLLHHHVDKMSVPLSPAVLPLHPL